ncbi:MAG: hypothetical protein KY467_09485 [Gemmatimonadetes bacterium]|nr:hypothetical protein [Gemmatimonadota bacterium]
MTKHLLPFAAVVAAAITWHAPAPAQDSLPALLPWGINGAEVSAALEANQLNVVLTRAGRDVHAASADRHLQAVAILRSDSLVGLVYFHPENAQLNALALFTQAASRAERTYGPPFCRKSDLAVWTLEDARLEVRLRRSVGDGAPGAEIRYIGPGYAEEMARRTTSRPSTPRPASTGRPSGPRLLGSPVPPPPTSELGAAPAPASPPEACAATA